MFKCRLRFNWTIYNQPGYRYNPLDSKYLTRGGAKQQELIFQEVPGEIRTAVLDVENMPTRAVPLPGGGTEEGVALDDVAAEIQRRLDKLRDHGWVLSIDAFPSNGDQPVQPYKYRVDPPECVHHYLLKRTENQTERLMTFTHERATVPAQMCATLEFWEVI